MFFFALVIAGLLGSRGVEAQYVDGGAVLMECGVCDCEGSTDDVAIEVFDNPASGARVRDDDTAAVLLGTAVNIILLKYSILFARYGLFSPRALQICATSTSEGRRHGMWHAIILNRNGKYTAHLQVLGVGPGPRACVVFG